MSDDVSHGLLIKLTEVLSAQMGLWYPPDRHSDLLRGLRQVGTEMGCADTRDCVLRLLDAPLTRRQIDLLARHLTIGETYFFRDDKSFQALRDQILRPLIYARQFGEKRLRLWSAACSSGEEPYSLAMLLCELMPRHTDWEISILATDLNLDALARAKRAEYSAWSFRALPDSLRSRYFKQVSEGRYVLADSIKSMVRFEHLNLIEDRFPSPISHTQELDVILCRNVLMYFTTETAQTVVNKLAQSLRVGGFLMTSSNEGPGLNFAPLQMQQFNGALAYKKSPPGEPRPAPPRAVATPAAPPRPARPASKPAPPAPATKVAAPVTANTTKQQEALAAARSWLENGEYEKAQHSLLEIEANATDTGVKVQASGLLARCCANLGRLAEARGWCEAALVLDKMNPSLYYLRAMILQEQGDAGAAGAALRQALYLDPRHIAAHLALGNLARSQNKPAEAQRNLANARELLLRLDPNSTVPDMEDIPVARILDMIGPAQ